MFFNEYYLLALYSENAKGQKSLVFIKDQLQTSSLLLLKIIKEVIKWQLTTHSKISVKNEISFRRILQKLSVLAVIRLDVFKEVSETPLSKLQSDWHII